MTFANHNLRAASRVARALVTLSLVFALCAAPRAFALDTGDIVVASTKGEVHVSVRGMDTKLRAGSVLELPATVRTGRDGAIELRQGATSINVGPDTILEFPALEKPGGSIDRIVQPRGTAFYNVGKRPGRKLRIETPFLVGVVKGTQFSIVAQDHATTISLFEGLLEVRSADDSDVIDLHAGEVATRDRAATDISVLKMEADATPPVQKAPAAKPAGAGGTPAPQNIPARPAESASGPKLNVSRGNDHKPPRAEPVTTVDLPVDQAKPRVDLGVDVPAGNSGADVQVSVDTPAGNGNGGVNVDVGATANVSVDVAVESPAGGVSVDVGVETPASAPAVDLGGAAIVDGTDTAVDVGVNAGQNEGAGANVDVSAGDGAATVDLGGNAATDGVGVDVSVGVGNVGVDLGVDLGSDTDIDLGLDDDNSGPGNSDDNGNSGNSGSGNSGSGSGSDNSGPGNASDIVDGLLDGLTKRSGKK
jgi:hypothetical protein